MGVYTKEEFKRLWDSDNDGGGITYNDIADCAKAWGISNQPRTRPMELIKQKVLAAAGCDFEEQEEDEIENI